MRRIRVRTDGLTQSQREYEYAWGKGFLAGRKKENLHWKDQVHKLQRDILSLQTTVEQKLYEEAVRTDEAKDLAKQLNDVWNKLFKAERARDAWRKQVRELTHGT